MASEIVLTIKATDQFSDVMSKYNTATQQAGTATKETAATVKSSSSGWDSLTASVTAGIAAYAGMKGLQVVGELISQGQAANQAQAAFNALTVGIGGYAVNLQAVRNATGNIIDDMTLQTASAKMLQMGIADSTDSLASLMEMSVKLGGAMGMDAGKAISDFTALMGQTSIMRLDNFGISSARVRDRIKELQESIQGLSREDAFRMATIEAGQDAIERLGAAASSAETPINRLGASLQNFAQDFAQNVATGVNALAGLAEIATGNNSIQVDQRNAEQQKVDNFDSGYSDLFAEAFQFSGGSLADMTPEMGDLLHRQMVEMFKIAQTNPEEFWDPEVFDSYISALPENYQEPFRQAFQATYELAQADAQNLTENQMRAGRMGAMVASAAGYDDQGMGEGSMAGVLRQQSVGATWDAKTAFYQGGGGGQDTAGRLEQMRQESQQRAYQELMAQRQDASNQMNQGYRSMYGEGQQALGMAGLDTGMDLFGQAQDFSGAFGSQDEYATQGEADSAATRATGLQQQYEAAAAELERMQGLADQGLISPDDLTRAQTLTNNLQGLSSEASAFADETQRAADALANMTLSQAFGQGGGGMMGEISDQVMGNMDENMSPEQRAAIQQQMDLASGRETQSSVAMSTTVAPMLAEMAQSSPEQAIQAMHNVEEFLKAAKAAGLGDEQIAGMLPNATGFSAQAGGGFAASTGLGGQGYSTQQLVNVGMSEQANAAAASAVGGGNAWGNAGAMGAAFGGNGVQLSGAASGGATAAGAEGGGATPGTDLAKAMGSAATNADRARGSIAGIAASMSTAGSAADTLATKLSTLPTSRRVQITIDVNDASGVLALLSGGATANEAMAGATQDAGGTPPGATANARADR